MLEVAHAFPSVSCSSPNHDAPEKRRSFFPTCEFAAFLQSSTKYWSVEALGTPHGRPLTRGFAAGSGATIRQECGTPIGAAPYWSGKNCWGLNCEGLFNSWLVSSILHRTFCVWYSIECMLNATSTRK